MICVADYAELKYQVFHYVVEGYDKWILLHMTLLGKAKIRQEAGTISDAHNI